MIAKLITRGGTRDEALAVMRRALAEFRIGPIKTTIPLHSRLMRHGNFIKSDVDIHWVERWLEQK
jgi:acetyl-CoA carboxylase, biotin carboxylase subunit